MKRIQLPDLNSHTLTETELTQLEDKLDAEFTRVRLAPESETKHYPEPVTVQDLQEILHRTATYTGEWYHSEVRINMDETDPEYVQLREQILTKGREAGIFIHEQHNVSPGNRNQLREYFQQHNINI